MIPAVNRMRSMFLGNIGENAPPRIGISIFRDGIPIVTAYEAHGFLARLRGLHAYPELVPGEALVIRPCRAVHTFGMSYDIDVAFLTSTGEIEKLACLSPRKWCCAANADVVVEMATGTINTHSLAVGQTLFKENGTWR